MTEEEKLLLQGPRKATPPALSVTATATGGIAPPAKILASPAPAPVSLVTPKPDDGLPPAAEGLDPLPDTDASGADIRAAAWDAETIKTDAWNYTQGKRNALATDMFARLPADAKARVTARRWDHENNWTSFEAMVMDEAAKSAIAAPQDWADVPLSMEAFDDRITKERRADLDEAMAILNQPGGGFSEFLGSGARAMTDQASLLMAPLGFGGGSALRIIAGEAALGAIGEAAVIPREQQVASELGIAQPDVLSRLAMGAAIGAGLSGAVLGIGKAAGMVFGRRAGIEAVTPATGDQLTSEIAIDKAEAELRGEPTVQEAINGSIAPLPGAENLPYNEAATLRAIIGVESGGQARAKNPASSATGLGQFIGSTWLSLVPSPVIAFSELLVRTVPGQTSVTKMFLLSFQSSARSESKKPCRACFDAVPSV